MQLPSVDLLSVAKWVVYAFAALGLGSLLRWGSKFLDTLNTAAGAGQGELNRTVSGIVKAMGEAREYEKAMYVANAKRLKEEISRLTIPTDWRLHFRCWRRRVR